MVKRFLIIFLPLVALLTGVLAVFYSSEVKWVRASLEARGTDSVNIRIGTIESEWKSIVSDLKVLSGHHELQAMLAGDEASHRKALADEFLLFCEKKGLYDQARFLDETGTEVVRVNYNDGKPGIVPDEQLQDKQQRYYFDATFQLEYGEVYVSPFDLNIERGEIEQPLKPVIRLGTPVFDLQGRKRGVVILNYLGKNILNTLEKRSAFGQGQVLLLNSEGFFLKGPRPEDEWGFMFEERSQRTFGNAFPEEWQRISEGQSGQFTTADGMFTFVTIYPLAESQQLAADEYYWKIVSHISPDVLNALPSRLFTEIVLFYAGLIVILATGSGFLARASVRRKQAEEELRQHRDRLKEMVEERTSQLVRTVEELRDEITKRKRLEEQLLQAQKMEVVGRLAGGVAHDFNNFLTGIIGYTQLLLQNTESDSDMGQDLLQIHGLADRAAGLTRQLLAFSRKQPLESVVFNLKETIENTSKMLGRLIGEDIDLKFVGATDLGSVKGDPAKIEQVLMNLAVNARDAMPSGGILTIETTNVVLDREYAEEHFEVKPGPYVMLSVSDNGCGMDEATRKQIFEPFFTTKEKETGTGLGLSMVYGIVTQHDGYIWVYSEPDKGTTFKIYLPRVDEKAQELPTKAEEEIDLEGSETILVVEDEKAVRDLAQRILEGFGYKIFAADGAEEAEGVFAERGREIDLLLTDVIMPGCSGPELYERLGAKRPSLKILYMSGYTEVAVLRNHSLDSSVPFIQKPFTPTAMAKKVREVLGLGG